MTEHKLSEQEITEVVIRDFLRNDERIIRTEMQDQCCGLIQRFINKMNKGMSTPNAAENLKQEILLRFSPFLKQGGLDYTENLSAQMDLYANAALTRERERVKGLEEWKRQQLLVMEKLDLQAIGKELEIGLGEDISIRVLPEIRRLKGIIQQLQSK